MKLATFKTAQGTSYGIVTAKGIVDLKRYIGNRFADLKALIGGNAFVEAAKYANEAPDYKESDVTWLPVIPNPDKIICVGLNYQEHVAETGRETTDQMIFKIPKIIEYISTWTTLASGDVLVTGTPGGVGARRNPPVWMKPGDKVEIDIDKVGILENTIADG